MKKIILIIIILLFVSCKTKTIVNKPVEPSFTKAALTDISESQKKKAYDLGKRTLMICNTSKFIPFNETEATRSVIQNTTLEKHSKLCLKFNAQYGRFVDLKLVEVYKKTSPNELLFRYKALYEHSNANKELRVTLNEENKISSLKTMDWSNTFQYK